MNFESDGMKKISEDSFKRLEERDPEYREALKKGAQKMADEIDNIILHVYRMRKEDGRIPDGSPITSEEIQAARKRYFLDVNFYNKG